MVKKETKRAVRAYETELANDRHNPKRLFAYVNSRRRARIGIDSMTGKDGVSTVDKKEIANILNAHFKSVFSFQADSELPVFEQRTQATLSDLEISTHDINTKLGHLNPNKAFGNDAVHPLVLRKCAAVLAAPLAYIYRRSLDESRLPDA